MKTSRIADELNKLGVQLHSNAPMSEHTTFRTGGKADFLVEPDSVDGLIDVLRVCREADCPHMVIGRGSNLLVSDAGYRGVIIRIGDGFSEIDASGDEMTAGAGATLSSIVLAGHREGLTGAECLSGIPGSLGGAVVMNAGAYGGEIKDFLRYVEVITPGLERIMLSASRLELGYRSSNIRRNGYIITGAALRLSYGDVDMAVSYLKELSARRREKQPLNYGSAGSTFKRPPGNFAGALIEQAGLKGTYWGGAQVSEKHAGFIINTGAASSQDVYSLIRLVKERVKATSGVELECEVVFLGDFDEDN